MVYLHILNHHKMLQFCQIGCITLILHWTLIINFSNVLRLCGICIKVKGVMPVLEIRKKLCTLLGSLEISKYEKLLHKKYNTVVYYTKITWA